MPTPEQVDKAIEVMRRQSINVNYFFSKLDDPSWIVPLRNRCLLNPPPLVIGENGNFYGTHIWPQADYLKRMAKKDDRKVQEQVLEIMLEVGTTNNYFIHEHFAKAALALQPDLAEKWANHEIKWLPNNRTYSLLENSLGRLISYLANKGKIDTALALAKELLAVFEDPDADKKKKPKDAAERIACSTLEPHFRCDKYNYEQILKKNIPDLAKEAPVQTFELLSRLLEKYVVYSLPEGEKAKPHDLLMVSRPAIEDHEQNSNFYIHFHLINILRNVVVDICRKDSEKLSEIVVKLESYKWSIFRRIALYLLTIIDPIPIKLAEERLVNDDLFDNSDVHHEYFHLIEKRFGNLSSEGKAKILGWIDAGQDYSKRDDLSEEQKKQRTRYWQYRQLCAIESFLDERRKDQFRALKEEFKEPGIPPDFHTWHSGISIGGPESPKTPEELSEMPMAELLQYLKDWKPSGKWMAPTPDGLGSVLNEMVANAPENFTAQIDRFMDKDLNPTYVKYLFRGFIRAIENKKPLQFESVFKLCKWVLNQSDKHPSRKIPEGLRENFDIDLNWKSTRHEIARLFEEKIFKDETGLPFELKEDAWAIVNILTEDPDPTLEYEKEYGGDNMDPLTLSLNHTRGKALHAVMSYAMWLYRRINQRENKKVTLADMSWVQTVLENHLNIKNSYGMCQTDRAIYGQWLPQIVHIGADWVTKNLDLIFPRVTELQPLREAAWNTYLLYSSQLYHNVTRLIEKIYREEILALEKKDIGEDMYKSPETRLAEHIVIQYLWKEFELEDGGLVDLLFQKAPEKLNAHTLYYLGRDVFGSKEKTDPEIVQRLIKLWEWRIKKANGIDKISKKELAAFGWWFAGGEFEPA